MDEIRDDLSQPSLVMDDLPDIDGKIVLHENLARVIVQPVVGPEDLPEFDDDGDGEEDEIDLPIETQAVSDGDTLPA